MLIKQIDSKVRLVIIFLLIIIDISVSAQIDTSYTQAEPIGGLNRLALVYYDIEYTPEQRKLLENVEVELIFTVSDEGIATLETVNGITNTTLIDSLFAQTPNLPKFQPELRGGIPKQSLYWIRFQFPTYQTYYPEIQTPIGFYQQKINKNQFKVLEESGVAFDFVIQGVFVNHFGNADKYLKPGGGVQMGFEFLTPSEMYYGLGLNMLGNKAALPMTVKDTMPYFKSPFTVTTGLYVGKRFEKFSVQLEIYYANITVTESDVEKDIDGTSYSGFGPGIFANYPVQLNKRKERVTMHSWSPFINRYALNIRGGIRGFFMENSQANAILLELGVGIRFGSYFIERYRMKDSYYGER